MNSALTRRRFITISAAVAGSNLALPGMSLAKGEKLYRWQGRALGAQAEMLLNLPTVVNGDKLLAEITAEISRLEDIFSIYKATSLVSQLNKTGQIDNPPSELIDILTKSTEVSDLTNGAFDVTVQPLWLLKQEVSGKQESDRLAQHVRQLVDYKSVMVSTNKISFAKDGMAITLNGIAQGYITDRVTKLLSSRGLTNSLVQLGETRALDNHPSGRDWQIGLQGQSDVKIPLNGRSLATSGGTEGSFVFNPKTSHVPSNSYDSVSVVASSATVADALSTAVYAMDKTAIRQLSTKLSDVNIYALENGYLQTL